MFLTTEERRAGIGGTDVGSIMGANPYRSPIACYKDKLGEMPPVEVNHAMEWGNRLEDVIGMKYSDDNNLYFYDKDVACASAPDFVEGWNGVMYKPTTARSEKHEWAYAHPDFYVFNRKERTGIEIKTVGEGIYKKYWAEGEIPPWQYYQVVWYSMVTKINKWTMVGFAPHLRMSKDPMLIHEIEIDLATQLKVWEKVEYFWECIQNKREPELEEYSDQDIKLLYPESNADISTSTKYIDTVVRNLFTVRAQLKPLAEQEEIYKNEIKSYMKKCGRLIGEDGDELATYKNAKARVTVDYKGIAKDLKQTIPIEVYGKAEDANTKAIVSARRFLLKYKEDV
jgi:predicted phage-related endonuclease|tara:strand:- start:615 stop:1634 length:1020 start_codon:yes stop_codon:yes gene_type:complete